MMKTVTVDVSEGTLRGKAVISMTGRTYYSFQGVPFAKPPVGPLRFKVAQPPEPWSGVRDALEEGSKCSQFDLLVTDFGGSEDCLHLAIYTPKLPASGDKATLMPVMVYIHGGAFVFNSGSVKYAGPDYLLDHGVVVVNINYRLGVLGFLCLHDPAAPGNIGLKDQVEALRWVQKNITVFGGDPNNVTIFGISAGAAAVHFQVLSAMAKGLFHKGIAQSGSALNPWAIEKRPREAAFRLARSLGFIGEEPKYLVEFLRGIDHMELVKAAQKTGLTEQDKERIIIFGFLPTLEIEVEGEGRFLPASPIELVEQGRYNDVPFITGVCEKEGLFVWTFVDFDHTTARIKRNFEGVMLPELRLPENYSKIDEVATKLKHFFMNDKPLSDDTLSGFTDMYSDLSFVEGVYITAKKMAERAKSPVYFYKFSHRGNLNHSKTILGLNFPEATHADDVTYVFHAHVISPEFTADASDSLCRDRVVKMWTNFAKTGNPTPEEDSLLDIKWEEHTVANPCFLEIDGKLRMDKDLFKERMLFWEELYSNL